MAQRSGLPQLFELLRQTYLSAAPKPLSPKEEAAFHKRAQNSWGSQP